MIDPQHFFEPPAKMIWPGIALYLAGFLTGSAAAAGFLYWWIFKR